MRRILPLLLAFCFISGCTQHFEEKGVVARVNGEPIYLKEMEARYDLNNLGWVSGIVPTVETMSAEYGNVLSELIVYKLVGQALQREGIVISPEQVQAEEDLIRTDYPDDLFEKTLTEEYIDIDIWRLFLKRHLELQQFLNDVLRSTISLKYQDVEAYYKKNLSEFYIPKRLHVLSVNGADKSEVLRISNLIEKTENWKEVVSAAPDSVTIRDMKLKKERLPAQWASVLQKLRPKKSSNISVTAYGFEQLVLIADMPEKLLGPTQAYSVIERILIEKKLNNVFMQWLATAVGNAQIEVTPLLSEKLGDQVVNTAEKREPVEKEEPFREPESEVGKTSDP